MSRHKFGGMVADWAFSFNSDGSVSQAGGAVLTFWDSLTGGTQYTAAPLPGGIDDGTGLLDGTGTPVSAVTCDGNGEIPDALQGPDGVYRMAADASGNGTGPRRWLYANDIGNDLTALLADVAGIPALAEAPVYVYYDAASASYPPRPSAAGPVWWAGPVAPPVGGTGAAGSDVWLNTAGGAPAGAVTSVTAGDASVQTGDTASDPTLETGTLDQVAALHPPAADWSNNSHKITSLAPGVASTDAATVGQLGGGGGGVSSVTAADTSVVVAGTASAPTVRTGTLDVIAADHPPAAAWSNNSKKITSLANGTAASDAAALGQVGVTSVAAGSGKIAIGGTAAAPVIDSNLHAPTDQGLAGWTDNPAAVTGSLAVTSGLILYLRVKCVDNRTAANLWVFVATAGATLTATQNLIGLYNAAGTQIGTCPDQSTAWAGTGSIPAALTVVAGQSLALTAGQFYYVALLANGTTTPAFARHTPTQASSLTVANIGITSAPYRFGKGGTGQTALPASFTPSAMTDGGANTIFAAIS